MDPEYEPPSSLKAALYSAGGVIIRKAGDCLRNPVFAGRGVWDVVGVWKYVRNKP